MSVYITVKASPRYRQMTLDEFLFSENEYISTQVTPCVAGTLTYKRDEAPWSFLCRVNIPQMIERLEKFNATYEELRSKPRRELYHSFKIPKKSGGLRQIDAPLDPLMNALRNLKVILEGFPAPYNGALYHTNAFAYIKKRNHLMAVQRHQRNESRWFAKYDVHNFFGSTTLEFVLHMFSMVFPFSEIVKSPRGHDALQTALELAFLDGVLPQGTPISPLITNIMMIPIDFELSKTLRRFPCGKPEEDREMYENFIYTRYADDFIVSSKYTFDFRNVENLISSTFQTFGAPFELSSKKTRYGSSTGQNFNLGLMLNKDNQITIGYREKSRFQCMLSSFIMDYKNGITWDIGDVQSMNGYKNYYHQIEGETIDRIITYLDKRFGVDTNALIKEALSAA